MPSAQERRESTVANVRKSRECGSRSRDDTAVAARLTGVGRNGHKGDEVPITLDAKAKRAAESRQLAESHVSQLRATMAQVAESEGEVLVVRLCQQLMVRVRPKAVTGKADDPPVQGRKVHNYLIAAAASGSKNASLNSTTSPE